MNIGLVHVIVIVFPAAENSIFSCQPPGNAKRKEKHSSLSVKGKKLTVRTPGLSLRTDPWKIGKRVWEAGVEVYRAQCMNL